MAVVHVPYDYFLWWGIPGLDTLAAGVMILMVLARSSPSQLNTLLSKSARLSTFLSKGVQKVDPGIQKFWEMIENQDKNLPMSEGLLLLADIHLNDQPFSGLNLNCQFFFLSYTFVRFLLVSPNNS